jgi:hypothetical protein
VEAVRLGTVYAHDSKAYKRWRDRPKKVRRSSLSDAALESAIMNIGRLFPENVVVVTA